MGRRGLIEITIGLVDTLDDAGGRRKRTGRRQQDRTEEMRIVCYAV